MAPTPTPVQDWTTFDGPPPTSPVTIDTAPTHVILPQHMAQQVHDHMHTLVMLGLNTPPQYFKYVFSQWAWNLTPDGKLKSEPGLSAEEWEIWHLYMKGKEGVKIGGWYWGGGEK